MDVQITPSWLQMMAKYNAWQNQWMYQAADTLSDDQRREDRGAFFDSIHKTLSHLMWGDTLWVSRFDGGPAPDAHLKGFMSDHDWPALMADRPKLDARIAAWAWSVDQAEMDGDLTWYSGMSQRDMTKPRALCVMQFFNHQTH